jgi:hypothetical protein
MHNALTEILTRFTNIVSSNFCNALARKVGLVKRSSSQLKGFEFAISMMVPHCFLATETLNSLTVRMNEINTNCNLSAPALAQRINTKTAVEFMKTCFAKVLKEVVQANIAEISDLPNLSCFNRVLIEDSTQAELHEKLSPHFKGSGGVASKSAVKIDYIFDYLGENIVDIDFCSANIPDQSLAHRIVSILKKDDLVIRDLGYYALERISEIAEKMAYYISRLKSDVVVYESESATEPLDLAKFIDKKIKDTGDIVDVEVFIGKNKIPTRLVASLMSEEGINKRQREANKASQRYGTQMSEKKKRLLKYCIFITNIPKPMLSAKSIMSTYRARWRVELIFKQWKSCLKLHIFKGYNKERFHCLLYGRLIMILLIGKVSSIMMRYALELGRELSSFKLTNYFIADNAFFRAVQQAKVDEFIRRLLVNIPRRLCMDMRKRPSLRSNVRNGNDYYTQQEIRGNYA